MSDLRPCCQQALLDGIQSREHWPSCDGRADDPDQDALFDMPDIEPLKGGGVL